MSSIMEKFFHHFVLLMCAKFHHHRINVSEISWGGGKGGGVLERRF